MQRAQIWRRGTVMLLAVWCVALPVIGVVRANKPTAEKTVAYIETHPLESKSTDERMRTVDEFVNQLNHLSFEDRQTVQCDRVVHGYYQQMTEAERARFWQRTLSAGMHQIIDAFNRMTPEDRRRNLNKALTELDRLQQDPEDLRNFLSEETRNQIVHEGLKRYLMEADSTAKLELQPVLEKVQSILQMGR